MSKIKLTNILYVFVVVFPLLTGNVLAQGDLWLDDTQNNDVTTNANVGIGTDSPGEKLHIVGGNIKTNNHIFIEAWPSFGTGKAYIWYNGDGGGGLQTGFLSLGADTYDQLVITSEGRVGIGINQPEERLHVVNGNIKTDKKLFVGDNIEADKGILINAFPNHGTGQGKIWYDGTDGDGEEIAFLGFGAGGQWSDLVIQDGGNVGIGTKAPEEKIHVNGQGRFKFDSGVVEIDGISNEPSNEWVRGSILFSRDGDLDYDVGTEQFVLGTATNNDFAAIMHRYPGQLGFYTGSGGSFTNLSNQDFRNTFERITIEHTGNVGIGCINPQNKLDVNGTIRATEVIVETGWCDFVFDDDYNLPSLDKVESYIKEKKHLPDIPSEKEIKEEGLSMASMMVKQMQKIEELTLYVIELKKENKELGERLVALEGKYQP